MSEPLRVLIVEDSADDVTLLLRHLRRDGYDPTFRRVDEARDMREALALETWDVVISDHAMPNFDALSALAVLKESQLDLPFIIVSGTIGEEVAVGAMKAGAHDYLMKNNLARLAPAVRRERQEAIVRRQMRQAEEDLRGYHAELETRVAERTAQLTEANERLAAGASAAKQAAEERGRLLQQVVEERRLVTELAAQAEASLSQLEAVVTSMSEGLMIADLHGNILTMNPAALSMHGFGSLNEAQQILHESPYLIELRHLDGRIIPMEEWPLTRALRGESFSNLETQLMRADSRELWIGNYNGTPVRNKQGEMILAIVTVRDVTIQKEAERLREEYISLISHDLRNPLTVLIGHAGMLQGLLAGKGLDREARAADSVVKSARRMNAMVQDLVESARLESGRLEIKKEPVDLAELIKGVVDVAGSDPERIRVKVAECRRPVCVDAARLERAVMNLLTNAVKYSPTSTFVEVRISTNDDDALIAVVDRGVGIPPEEIPMLFTRFYRARTSSDREGLGLGLLYSALDRGSPRRSNLSGERGRQG